jgi:bacterial/archaeal transporter family protein
MNWFYWALGSAGFAALTALLAKVGVEDVNPNLAMAVRTSVAMLFSWLLAWATMPAGGWSTPAPRSLLFLVLSGGATGLSWMCYFHALRVGPVSRVAAVDKLSVALAAILAVTFLGERLGPRGVAGLTLMVAGAALMAWK